MRKAFIITNQCGHYLGKQKEWLSGNDRRLLYRSEHRDEAVNTVFELSSKDFDLRASIAECELDEQGQPRVSVVELPDEPTGDALTGDEAASDIESNPAINEKETENL